MYLELLQQLSVHCQWSRQSGHSAAMLQGAIASDCMILVVDANHARDLSKLANDLTRGGVVLNRERFITIAQAPERLMGQRKPVLIDHTKAPGWAVVEMMDGKMCCYPRGDGREHDLEAPCWCSPFYAGDVLVHQSADRREESEPNAVFPRNA